MIVLNLNMRKIKKGTLFHNLQKSLIITVLITLGGHDV